MNANRRIMIYLSDDELAALRAVAVSERRPTRDQAAHIIVQELRRLGYLSPVAPNPDAPQGDDDAQNT